MINLVRLPRPAFSRYERLIGGIGQEDADRAAGRERLRFYRDRGYPLNTHDLSGAGVSA